MSDREARVRTAIVVYFPMFIATLSLLTSIFNGYLNSKFIDIIQSNFGRGEYMRTCKEAIDSYFQVKARAGLIHAEAVRKGNADAAAGAVSPYYAEGVAAVSRFGALGTYLANLRNENIRVRYTELSDQLEKIMQQVGQPNADVDKLFAPADAIFGEMNDDCIKSAKAAPM